MKTSPEAIQKPIFLDFSIGAFQQLQSDLDATKKALEEAVKDNQILQEQIDWLKNQLFGPKSEKLINKNADVLYLEGLGPVSKPDQQPTEEKEEPKTPKSRKKRNPNKQDAIKLPADIEVQDIIIDVSDEEKICPVTGKPMVKIGQEVQTRIFRRKGSFYVKRYIRPKYASPSKESDQPIVIAEAPEQFLPGCIADESLLAELCVSKYGDHQPLHRTAEILERQGLEISRQTLNEWVLKSAERLGCLYDLMNQQIYKAPCLFIDESPIKLLKHTPGKAHQGYVWLMTAEVAPGAWYTVYHVETSRQHKHAEDLLKGYLGWVHSDKYEAYEVLAKAKKIRWCPCWVHIRRNFIEATTALEVKNWFLRKIGALFDLERQAWEKTPEERIKIRLEQEVPIIDEILEAAEKRIHSGKDLPKSKMRQALNYLWDLKPYLKNYTLNPNLRLDNNPVERQVRPIALGRKNWLFLGSQRGGDAAEVLFTLIQTCRMQGINPTLYLEDIMRRLNTHPYHRLHELLPDEWAKLHAGSKGSVLLSEIRLQEVLV